MGLIMDGASLTFWKVLEDSLGNPGWRQRQDQGSLRAPVGPAQGTKPGVRRHLPTGQRGSPACDSPEGRRAGRASGTGCSGEWAAGGARSRCQDPDRAQWGH